MQVREREMEGERRREGEREGERRRKREGGVREEDSVTLFVDI